MGLNVLVLNQNYLAINICSVERAFVLVYLKKAELIKDVPEKSLKSQTDEFVFPSIIRLYQYVNIPYKRVPLTRQNIFRRDGNCCVYCESKKNLTLDHVLPRSRGGNESWKNLVTACQPCNTHKGNRTPEEAQMALRIEPFSPSYLMYLRDFTRNLSDDWKPYLMAN